MIIIDCPIKKVEAGYSFLETEVSIDEVKQKLWFKVQDKYEQYLCHERGDAYLIAFLHYAMLHGHDITLKAPITESLLFKIENYLIPALTENNPQFYTVNIIAETDNSQLPNAGAVGTGISCGVDSLHVLSEHTISKYKSLNVTHLAFNNVGSHGRGEKSRELYESRLVKPEQFAMEYGFEFIASDSNLAEVIDQSHFKTHTYSSMFPVLCLQKLYSVYFYASSGYKFSEFNLVDKTQSSCGSYDLLSLNVFSTPQTYIYSEGMGLSRMDKLKKVTEYEPSYRYLNVCLKEDGNCGKCEKCIRTLLGLDALGMLDSYKDVFDTNDYRKHKKWYLQKMLYRIKDKKHDYLEMYPYFKSEINLMMRTKAFLYTIIPIIKQILRKSPYLFSLAKRLR